MTVTESLKAFGDAMKAYQTKDQQDVDAITALIAALNAKIKELQDSAGTLTPEDQALLDSIQADGLTLEGKLDALAATTPPSIPKV